MFEYYISTQSEEYYCSDYHDTQANKLEPDDSESRINAAVNSLERRANELDRLEDEIDSTYVDNYSPQWRIDEYNNMVDEYNNELSTYKKDYARLQSRLDKYDRQSEIYNNYLIENCDPA